MPRLAKRNRARDVGGMDTPELYSIEEARRLRSGVNLSRSSCQSVSIALSASLPATTGTDPLSWTGRFPKSPVPAVTMRPGPACGSADRILTVHVAPIPDAHDDDPDLSIANLRDHAVVTHSILPVLAELIALESRSQSSRVVGGSDAVAQKRNNASRRRRIELA